MIEKLVLHGFKDHAGNQLAYRLDIGNGLELCLITKDMIMRLQTKGSGFTIPLPHIKSIDQVKELHKSITGREL